MSEGIGGAGSLRGLLGAWLSIIMAGVAALEGNIKRKNNTCIVKEINRSGGARRGRERKYTKLILLESKLEQSEHWDKKIDIKDIGKHS